MLLVQTSLTNVKHSFIYVHGLFCVWWKVTYVHGGIDLTDSLIICWELIDLHAVAHQLTHNLYFKFMELALGDCVRFSNDGNYVDLKKG